MKILDGIYEEMKTSNLKTGMHFNDIFEKLNLENESSIVNNVYTGIHFDHRFVMVGNNKWSLREFFTFEEVDNLQASNMHQSEIVE
ncbi:MAG: DNA-directed RNA polymerase subunit delta [Mycoplasmataceae bacterium]|nr:DNA-directed RNA polymerase subunit delta [Mycoplasmataceae bacterium]